MAERPILFSAPMVRAILEGRKTQTRRLVKPAPDARADWLRSDMNDVWRAGTAAGEFPEFGTWRCPYGRPGDRLWVREAFRDARGAAAGRVLYRATGDVCCGWKPSIHMPRSASRITLEVTNMRVERLQDIREADAIAEGAEPYRLPVHPDREELRYVDGFRKLWESIHGTDSWDANPWVWLVEFRRVEGEALSA